MKPTVNPRRISHLVAVARTTSALVFVAGGTVLLGWQLDTVVMTSMLPGRVAMNPVTALGFMLAAGALWVSLTPSSTRGPRSIRTGRVAAVLLMLIGAVTLTGYAVGVNLG